MQDVLARLVKELQGKDRRKEEEPSFLCLPLSYPFALSLPVLVGPCLQKLRLYVTGVMLRHDEQLHSIKNSFVEYASAASFQVTLLFLPFFPFPNFCSLRSRLRVFRSFLFRWFLVFLGAPGCSSAPGILLFRQILCSLLTIVLIGAQDRFQQMVWVSFCESCFFFILYCFIENLGSSYWLSFSFLLV